MIWEEWVNSEYNVDGLYIQNNSITDGHCDYISYDSNGKKVLLTDIIIPNYYLGFGGSGA
jgi:hypothetical protein